MRVLGHMNGACSSRVARWLWSCGHRNSKTLRCLTQSKGPWCSPTIADARDDDPDGPAALESRGHH
jgi:hypothetical protein